MYRAVSIFPKWKSLQVAFKDNHIGWSEDEETRLKKLFIEAILVDQTFLAYLPNAGKNFEDDLLSFYDKYQNYKEEIEKINQRVKEYL